MLSKVVRRWIKVGVFLFIIISSGALVAPTTTSHAQGGAENGTLTRISKAHYPLPYSAYGYLFQNIGAALSRDGVYSAVATSPTALGYGLDTLPLFIHNRARRTVTPIAATPDGADLPPGIKVPTLAFSDDGRYLAFETNAILSVDDGGEYYDIYLYDQVADRLILVTRGRSNTSTQGNSSGVRVSADGRYTVFASYAANLIPDDTNGKSDVFRYEIATGTIERISVGLNGAEANDDSVTPVLSADGSVIAFTSSATNLDPTDTYGLCYRLREDGNCPDIFVWDENAGGTFERVSVATDGIPANFKSYAPEISADGQTVFFLSDAYNLDPIDGNNETARFCGDLPYPTRCNDIYLHNRTDNTLRLISLNQAGNDPGGSWANFRISGDGAQVVATTGRNVVPDIIEYYSCDRGGCLNTVDTIRIDVARNEITALTPAPNGSSTYGDTRIEAISSDGNWVVFGSTAGEWFPGDVVTLESQYTYGCGFGDYDFGLLYRPTTTYLRLTAVTSTQTNNDSILPAYLPDSQTLIFNSRATNMAIPPSGAYFYENGTDTITPLLSSYEQFYLMGEYHFTPDGGVMVANSEGYLVWYDRTGSMIRPQLGRSLHYPLITPDASQILFASADDTIAPQDTNEADDIFLFDIATQQLRHLSAVSATRTGNGESTQPTLQPDGNAVVYVSRATNIITDTNTAADLYRYDLKTGDTTFLITGMEGVPTNGDSTEPIYALDGDYVAFTSLAGNLVASDTNSVADVFVVNTTTGEIERVSVATDGAQSNGESSHPVISRDGRFVAFVSAADNLIAEDPDGTTANVFLHDRATGETITLSYLPDGTPLFPDLTTFDLSDDGQRFLFTTNAPLEANDRLGFRDVYEWNRSAVEVVLPYHTYLPAIAP